MPLSKGAVHLQELKSKLESWRGDGWLEQCCTSLAEQLRVAQAENTELQQELEALRYNPSACYIWSTAMHLPM